MSTETEKAWEMGRAARKSGALEIPARDENLMTLLAGRDVSDPQSRAILKAWASGYRSVHFTSRTKPEPGPSKG